MKTLFALLLLTSAAWAQPQPNQLDKAIKDQMGELIFNSTIMSSELKRLSEENTKLKAEVKEWKFKYDAQTGECPGVLGVRNGKRFCDVDMEKEDAKQKP